MDISDEEENHLFLSSFSFPVVQELLIEYLDLYHQNNYEEVYKGLIR